MRLEHTYVIELSAGTFIELLFSLMYLLMTLEVIEPCESLSTLRTLVRSFSTMAKLMILAMEVTREHLSTQCASVGRFSGLDCCGGFELFRQVTPLGVIRAHMLLKILVACKTFGPQTVVDFTPERATVKIHMSLACRFILEPFGKVSASDFRALVSLLVVVKLAEQDFVVGTRIGFWESFQNFPVAFKGFPKSYYADSVSRFEAFLLNLVDMASDLHQMLVQRVMFEHATNPLAVLYCFSRPIYLVVKCHEIIHRLKHGC